MLGTLVKWTVGTLLVGYGWYQHLTQRQQEWREQREWQEQLNKDEEERFRQEMDSLARKNHGKPFEDLNGAQQQDIFLEVYNR